MCVLEDIMAAQVHFFRTISYLYNGLFFPTYTEKIAIFNNLIAWIYPLCCRSVCPHLLALLQSSLGDFVA
jgi:hypothetical protein